VTVLDSSCWLEILGGTEKGKSIHHHARDLATLVVPTITMYEVFKRVSSFDGTQSALKVIALMKRGVRVDLDDTLAVEAARLSMLHKLPMADAIIYASSLMHDATLYTFDAHFKGLAGVEYLG
jgi:predicted nucleic acid-binding protein